MFFNVSYHSLFIFPKWQGRLPSILDSFYLFPIVKSGKKLWSHHFHLYAECWIHVFISFSHGHGTWAYCYGTTVLCTVGSKSKKSGLDRDKSGEFEWVTVSYCFTFVKMSSQTSNVNYDYIPSHDYYFPFFYSFRIEKRMERAVVCGSHHESNICTYTMYNVRLRPPYLLLALSNRQILYNINALERIMEKYMLTLLIQFDSTHSQIQYNSKSSSSSYVLKPIGFIIKFILLDDVYGVHDVIFLRESSCSCTLYLCA